MCLLLKNSLNHSLRDSENISYILMEVLGIGYIPQLWYILLVR
jgi:hypothetical protein